jgi:hypothetical protein
MTLSALAFAASARAQTSDALIDKLVDKGILTAKEAKELREEADSGFNKAFAAKTGLPDWVTSLKFSGDFRGRFEKHNVDNPANSDRNRFRYRLRFGVTALLLDDFEVGFRLASGKATGAFGGNPVSANTDFADGGSRKFVWMDAAYAKWNPIHNADWNASATIGKFDMPFSLSPMIFDSDYVPEGAALQLTYNLSDAHVLKFNGAGFVLDEFDQGAGASRDPFLFGGQLMLESKWSPKIDTALTVAGFGFGNKDNLLNGSAPNINNGNTRTAAGILQHNFNPVVVGASLIYKLPSGPLYKAEFPVKLGGEYLDNPGAPSRNKGWWGGLTLGKAGHKGLWEIAYKYQRLEADAWYEEFPDDDNGAYYQAGLAGSGNGAGYFGGTNVKGHILKLTYNFTDSLNLAVTYYLTDLINPNPTGSISGAGHVMVDLMWKF